MIDLRPNIDKVKRRAEQLARLYSAHAEVLDELVRRRGYSNWSQLTKDRGANT